MAVKKGDKKADKRNYRREKRMARVVSAFKWTAALAVVAFIIYGLSRSAGIAYDEEDIAVVDFSGLTDTTRRDTLREANRARCTCGCGMGLAQCVSTDMTCPIRDRNVERIRTMVRQAG